MAAKPRKPMPMAKAMAMKQMARKGRGVGKAVMMKRKAK